MIKVYDKIFDGYICDFENGHIIDKSTFKQLDEFLINDRPHVTLVNEGKSRYYPVHMILCHTFYGYIKGYDIHHINEDKTDNRFSNLTYISHAAHSSITGSKNLKCLWNERRDKMLQIASNAGKNAMKKATKEFHSKGGKAGIKVIHQKMTPEMKLKIATKNSIKMKNKVWVNNGLINRRVDKEQLQQFFNCGYCCGRI